MRKLKVKEEFKAYSEQEAIQALEELRANQTKEGYTLGENGYKYKTKKAKKEIIGEAWIVTVVKIYHDVWEDLQNE